MYNASINAPILNRFQSQPSVNAASTEIRSFSNSHRILRRLKIRSFRSWSSPPGPLQTPVKLFCSSCFPTCPAPHINCKKPIEPGPTPLPRVVGGEGSGTAAGGLGADAKQCGAGCGPSEVNHLQKPNCQRFRRANCQ